MKRKKSTFFKDFKAFISRGNIIDLALAVIIGGAFSKIVNSLVSDIIMPLLTLATGDGVQGLSLVLNGVDKYLADGSLNPDAVLWNYGNFIQSIINFLVIALCLFTALRIITKARDAAVKHMEHFNKENGTSDAEAPAEAPAEVAESEKTETAEDLLKQIRDLLEAERKEKDSSK